MSSRTICLDCHYGVFIFKFKQISHISGVSIIDFEELIIGFFPLLTLNK